MITINEWEERTANEVTLSNKKYEYFKGLEQQVKKQKEVIDRVIKILDIIIYDLEEHEEALPPTKEELCKVFNILKEVSE